MTGPIKNIRNDHRINGKGVPLRAYVRGILSAAPLSSLADGPARQRRIAADEWATRKGLTK